ncbi:MAG: class I tRNA ligase family protein [Parcubacteria group bacterium]
MPDKFYITTPIYYVNAKPHIGHAYTTIAADVLARMRRSQGRDVFFLTGTDEHGLKIQKKAAEAGKDPQRFVDDISEEFKGLWRNLDIEYSGFIRTTDTRHVMAVQKSLQILYDKGAIYKGKYSGMYCVGCELFKSENELVDGKCPDHDTVPERMEEECYLLKMSDIQNELIGKIENDEFRIAPERYKNEILSFLKNQTLNDVSISRRNVGWGVPLPFDPEQTTYVWIDAFLNYLTGIGWNGETDGVPEEWPADVQFIGKDILRVHATIWPAILIHLGIGLPKMLFTHGHILSDGKKMSKTLGNAISIEEMLEKFGTDGTRYLLLSAGPFGQDIDVTMERMVENYNADLANGIGNITSRIVALNQRIASGFDGADFLKDDVAAYDDGTLQENLKNLRLDLELRDIMIHVQELNKYIADNKPWEVLKNDEVKFAAMMEHSSRGLLFIANKLLPFMPATAEKIKKALAERQVEILFQRIK